MAVIKKGTIWTFDEYAAIGIDEYYHLGIENYDGEYMGGSIFKDKSPYGMYEAIVIRGGLIFYNYGYTSLEVYSTESGWKSEDYRTIEFLQDVEVDDENYTNIKQYVVKEEFTTPTPDPDPDPSEPQVIAEGTVSGTGIVATRENEITADNVATFRHFCVGYESGVVYDVGNDFYAKVDGYVDGVDDGKTATGRYSNTVHVSGGTVFAYGYFGSAKATDFTFLPPAVEQWHIIYAELDRSIIPNRCTLKTKNNQSSSRILPNTFRQDELSLVKTGVYQVPLWFIRVTNKGVEVEDLRTNEYTNPQGRTYDLRQLRKYIKNVYNTDNTSRVTGTIDSTVTCERLIPDGTADNTVANREFVQRRILTAMYK